MTKHTTVLADLLRPLSRSEFESAIKGYNADYRTRTLSTWDLFKTVVYGHVSGCFSVREIEASMQANQKRLYHAGIKQVTKRTTLCDALEKRRHDIFRSVFLMLADKAQTLAGKNNRKFTNPLRILDASTIPLCLSRYDWAKYRKTKGAVKLHVNLDGDNLFPLDAYLTDGKVHESQQLQNLCQEHGVIYDMDRGYVDYKSLYCIELQGSVFVTRMKRNGKYKRIKNNPHKDCESIVSDVEIVLTGPLSKTYYPKPLGKIKYREEETGKVYEFLTNDMERPAIEIAGIYKERWEVELFFKWIKGHLKIKSFYGTSENAVKTQIWIALIVTLMLWLNRVLNGIHASAYELLIRVKTTLLNKNTLSGLCSNIPPPEPIINSFQPFLEGFLC